MYYKSSMFFFWIFHDTAATTTRCVEKLATDGTHLQESLAQIRGGRGKVLGHLRGLQPGCCIFGPYWRWFLGHFEHMDGLSIKPRFWNGSQICSSPSIWNGRIPMWSKITRSNAFQQGERGIPMYNNVHPTSAGSSDSLPRIDATFAGWILLCSWRYAVLAAEFLPHCITGYLYSPIHSALCFLVKSLHDRFILDAWIVYLIQ